MKLVDVLRQRRRIVEHGVAVGVATAVNLPQEGGDRVGATRGSDDFGRVSVRRVRVGEVMRVRMDVVVLRMVRVKMIVGVRRVDVGVRGSVGVVMRVRMSVSVGVRVRVGVGGVGVVVRLIARRVRGGDVRGRGSAEEGVGELASVETEGREVIVGVSFEDVVSRIAALRQRRSDESSSSRRSVREQLRVLPSSHEASLLLLLLLVRRRHRELSSEMISKQMLKEDLRRTHLLRSSSCSLSSGVLLHDHVGSDRKEMRIRSPLTRQSVHRRVDLLVLLLLWRRRRSEFRGSVEGERRRRRGWIRDRKVRRRGFEVFDELIEGGEGLVAV